MAVKVAYWPDSEGLREEVRVVEVVAVYTAVPW